MTLDFSGNKKKYKDGKYSIVQLDLFKPTSRKYPEFDYGDIKTQLNEGESSGDDERFHDKEALELVRRLEAKYGNDKKGKKKKKRFGCADDFIDKTYGYDLEDAFIDDSEAYDELIPSTMDTAKGGFYVNKGKLEFRPKNDNMDDLSDEDEEMRKPKKRPLAPSTSELVSTEDELMDDIELAQGTSNGTVKNNKVPPVLKQAILPRPRMAGAPPTKKHLSDNSAVRLAQQIKKKRFAGQPPTLMRQKNLPPPSAPKSVNDFNAPPEPSSCGSSNTDDVQEIEKDGESVTILPAPATQQTSITTDQITSQQKPVPGVIGKTPFGSPKKGLPPMTETLSKLISTFKKATLPLAGPGQKKRLQKEHVAMVVAIEDQCTKDKFNAHEKSRVIESLANYVGIQRQSLYLRVKTMREDGKKDTATNGLPSITPPVHSLPLGNTTVFNEIPSTSNTNVSAPSFNVGSKPIKSTSTPSVSMLPTTVKSPIPSLLGNVQKKADPPVSKVQKQAQPTSVPRKLTEAEQQIFVNVANLLKESKAPDDIVDIMKRLYVVEKIALNEVMVIARKMATSPSKVSIIASQIRKTYDDVNNTTLKPTTAPSSQSLTALKSGVVIKRPASATSSSAPPAKATPPVKTISPTDPTKLKETMEHFMKMVKSSVASAKAEYANQCQLFRKIGRPTAEVKKTMIWGERLLIALREFVALIYKLAPIGSQTTIDCLRSNLHLFENFVTFRELVEKTVEVYPLCKEIRMHPEVIKANLNAARPLSQSQAANQDAAAIDDDIQAGPSDSPSTSKTSTVEKKNSSEAATSTRKSQEAASLSKPSKMTKSAEAPGINEAMIKIMAQAYGISSSELVSALINPTTAAMMQAQIMSNPAAMAAMQQVMLASTMSTSTKSLSDEKKKKEEEKKRMEEEKKKIEEEKKKMAEQKKNEIAAAKQRALDEKRKQKEEEKKKLEEEKARKAEEDRQKRLLEEAEKEKKREEMLQVKIKEEADQLKREEQRRKELENMRIKKEEERALMALEDDLLDPDEKEETIREREEAETADRIRLEEQRIKVQALREATIKQQPLSPVSNSPMRPASHQSVSCGNSFGSPPSHSNTVVVPKSPSQQSPYHQHPPMASPTNHFITSSRGQPQKNRAMAPPQSPHAVPSSPMRAGFASPAGSQHSMGHQNEFSMGSPFSRVSGGPSPMSGFSGSHPEQSPIGLSNQYQCGISSSSSMGQSPMGYPGTTSVLSQHVHGMPDNSPVEFSGQSPITQSSQMGYGLHQTNQMNAQMWQQQKSQYQNQQMQQMKQQRLLQEQQLQIQNQRMMEEQRRAAEEQQRQMQLQREHEEQQRQVELVRHQEELRRQQQQRMMEEQQQQQRMMLEQQKQQRLLEEQQKQQLMQQRLLEDQQRQQMQMHQQRLLQEQQRQNMQQQQMMQQSQFQQAQIRLEPAQQSFNTNQQQLSFSQQQQQQMMQNSQQQLFFNGIQQSQGNNYQAGQYQNGGGYY